MKSHSVRMMNVFYKLVFRWIFGALLVNNNDNNNNQEDVGLSFSLRCRCCSHPQNIA